MLFQLIVIVVIMAMVALTVGGVIGIVAAVVQIARGHGGGGPAQRQRHRAGPASGPEPDLPAPLLPPVPRLRPVPRAYTPESRIVVPDHARDHVPYDEYSGPESWYCCRETWQTPETGV